MFALGHTFGFLSFKPKPWWQGDKLREKFFRAIINYPKPEPAWPDFEIPEEVFRAALNEINPFTLSEGYRTFYRLYAARFGKSRWGDKTPLYCYELETIRRVLPEARFIHLIRDGRDAALSLRKLWFSPGQDIATIAGDWQQRVRAGRQGGAEVEHYLEVRYENLVSDPGRELRRVCDFIELAYDQTIYRAMTGGAQVMMVQSNNATYGGTGQIEQQFAITRARAMETRREIAVATARFQRGCLWCDERERRLGALSVIE